LVTTSDLNPDALCLRVRVSHPLPNNACIAQPVEQLVANEQVAGSNPVARTKTPTLGSVDVTVIELWKLYSKASVVID
jgi:hypothetical protein